jgi:aspartyl-tRNA(Asn)/glutamyl-tRNA(Gln) amidotransferase subunit B
MVRRAIIHEQERQSAILDAGESTDDEETRLWDDDAGETRLMRKKEDSADYRYFPDPDLPPHDIDPALIEEQRALLGELPGPRKTRYVNELKLSEKEALPLVQHLDRACFFEETAKLCGSPQKAANWVLGELFAALKPDDPTLSDLSITPERLADLISLTDDGTLNTQAARKVFSILLTSDGSPREIADQEGLLQLSDESELRASVQAAIEANPKAVDDIRGGNKKAAGALVGAVMKATSGRANPGMVNRLITELLG